MYEIENKEKEKAGGKSKKKHDDDNDDDFRQMDLNNWCFQWQKKDFILQFIHMQPMLLHYCHPLNISTRMLYFIGIHI